jgi:hypothetical protein
MKGNRRSVHGLLAGTALAFGNRLRVFQYRALRIYLFMVYLAQTIRRLIEDD